MIKNRPDADQDRLQQFYIYLLKDDGTTINDEKYISHTVGAEEAFYFGGSLARYVKIEMPYRSTVPFSYLQLAEVEVFESSTCNITSYSGGFLIEDPADEDQCRNAREMLNFDRDYTIDSDVCDEFEENKCDNLFFDQIDSYETEVIKGDTFTYEPKE